MRCCLRSTIHPLAEDTSPSHYLIWSSTEHDRRKPLFNHRRSNGRPPIMSIETIHQSAPKTLHLTYIQSPTPLMLFAWKRSTLPKVDCRKHKKQNSMGSHWPGGMLPQSRRDASRHLASTTTKMGASGTAKMGASGTTKLGASGTTKLGASGTETPQSRRISSRSRRRASRPQSMQCKNCAPHRCPCLSAISQVFEVPDFSQNCGHHIIIQKLFLHDNSRLCSL